MHWLGHAQCKPQLLFTYDVIRNTIPVHINAVYIYIYRYHIAHRR